MALWEYTIQENNFTLDNYPPLTVSSYNDTFESIGFSIDISYEWYSTLYYVNTTRRVVMTGAITGYKQNNIGGWSNYPCVNLCLGGYTYGDGYCGVRISVDSCCNVSLFQGYFIENGNQTELQSASYDHRFNGDYTANARIIVNQCTLPITFTDCSEDEINYMVFSALSVYDVPPILQFCNYTPIISANNALTSSLCEDHIINYSGGETVPETKEYFFSTIAREYTVDSLGNVEELDSPEIYRGFKIRSTNKVSLYKLPGIDDGKLKYKINFSDAFTCYYSTDYGNTWMQVPGQPNTLPYDWTYRPMEGEIGTYYCAVGDPTNPDILIFDNEEDSDEYNSGESDGRKASNYNQIMNGGFDNPTGEEDEETEFGEVKTRGFFSQQYIMDAGSLQALANDLFDTSIGGIWEAIKKGLDMYGDNPIEAVMGLSFWPVSLSSVFQNVTPATKIWFGGYGWDVTGGSASKINYPNGYKNLGSLAIKRTFRNWRDFAPYTRLYVSLPYVGVYELDLTRYYDKTVEVRYFFDTRTNGCIAALIADGHLMDYFNGQMGVTMPITLTDYAGYANSQIATLLGAGALAAVAATGVGAAVAGAGSAALGLAGTAVGTSGLAGAAAAAGAAGAAGGAVGIGLGGAAVAGTALGAKTAYGLSQNNINKHNVTKGGSSSMINEYLPQYVEFIFEIQEDCAPDNYGAQYGYPSMKSGSVGSFQGFLKCQSVKLDCGVATENEKNQIKTMLLNGIYI